MSSVIFPQALANPAIEDYPESMSKLPKELSPGEEAFALHCRAEKLTPEREWTFHPKRKWRFDFAWPALKLALEVEGRRHLTYAGFIEDCGKYNTATMMGWRVLRYTPAMVMAGTAINDVLEILKA
jgi:very-short-patch-repair endonuclease